MSSTLLITDDPTGVGIYSIKPGQLFRPWPNDNPLCVYMKTCKGSVCVHSSDVDGTTQLGQYDEDSGFVEFASELMLLETNEVIQLFNE